MTDKLEEFEALLKKSATPAPDEAARKAAISRAMAAYDEKFAHAAQGTGLSHRLMDAVRTIHNAFMGEAFMKRAYILAGAGVLTLALLNTSYLSGLLPPEPVPQNKMDAKQAQVAADMRSDKLTLSPGALPAPPSPAELSATESSPAPAKAKAMEFARKEEIAAGGASRAKDLEKNEGLRQSDALAEKKTARAEPSLTAALNKPASSAMPASPAFEAGAMGNLMADQPASIYHDEGRDKFDHAAPNPVKQVSEEPVSTFSIDVDTSSYSFMRASINHGALPQPDAVRTEELINYFPYEYEAPKSAEEPFSTDVSVFPTPWNHETKLMRIGIKGYEIAQREKPHSNLVFLLDTSGSMDDPVRLPLVINAMKLLLDSLKPDDTVAIVTYAGNAGIALEPTEVKDREKIISTLDNLHSQGSTAGFDGLKTAYALAERHFDAKSVNRVILSTDGDFNVGITDQGELKHFIEGERDKGIFLSILGVGMGNFNDGLMQTLAQNGNGVAAYIDNLNEARKVLVEEAGSTLFTIAKDVKIQVEFNPATVAEYRLIGYENRVLKREDFNNDKVDAGDVGSGHAVTAIYEITPAGGAAKRVDDLRYQKPAPAPALRKESEGGEVAFVKIRYKLPKESASKLISTAVDSHNEAKSLDEAPQEARFAAAVAAYGQLLKGDADIGSFTYDDVITLARSARGGDPFGYRAEFINLVELAKHEAHPAMPVKSE